MEFGGCGVQHHDAEHEGVKQFGKSQLPQAVAWGWQQVEGLTKPDPVCASYRMSKIRSPEGLEREDSHCGASEPTLEDQTKSALWA